MRKENLKDTFCCDTWWFDCLGVKLDFTFLKDMISPLISEWKSSGTVRLTRGEMKWFVLG